IQLYYDFSWLVSDIETESYDISVLHDIFLPFQAQASGRFYLCGGAAVGDEIIIVHNFCLDKTPFKVIMNCAGSLGSFGLKRNNPCFDFVLADSEKGHAPQERKRCADNPAKRRFGDSHGR